MNARVPITPETKVGALLDDYPELEPVLIGMAPTFSKLRNPILRRTIAKVTSLATAAKVGNLQVQDLVRSLREAAGLGAGDPVESASDAEIASEPAPEWLSEATTMETVEADELLASDLTPLQVVTPKLRALRPGEMLRIRSSFRPEPLIETLRDKGHLVYCRAMDASSFETFVLGKSG